MCYDDGNTMVSDHNGNLVAANVNQGDGIWIALLGPDKADPLAAWLDASAQSMPWQFVHSAEQAAALAFARSILHTEGVNP